jgi:D-serine deaminase-like pyridoxal phosphate-dependent protein
MVSFADQLTVPTLMLDERRCRRNIERMAQKAQRSGVRFRPHFKTHQSAAVGAWFREVGVEAITASSLRMAEYFADDGWRDITVAFPVNIREIERINQLAARITLGLIVDSVESAELIAARLTHSVNVWIEVDTGDQRSGVDWNDGAVAVQIAHTLRASPLITLSGLLTHAGRSYTKRSPEDMRAVYGETVARLTALRGVLSAAGYSSLALSLGDTPCCSLVDDFSAADEIRPGNFVYYDLTQAVIGSCAMNDIAVAVACPVVSKNAERGQVVVYGGAVHLSKDTVVDGDGRTIYGLVSRLTLDDPGAGWGAPLANTYVRSLSQEHGVLQTDTATLASLKVGDVLAILPVHSCLTADLLKQCLTLGGETLPMLHLDHV